LKFVNVQQFIGRKKMANFKIHNLHSTDSKMHQQAKMSNFKIDDLCATNSGMHELADDEAKNIIGGVAPCPYPLHGDSPYPPHDDNK
jgi:hypothetical protein